jgi:DDE superfamily endonuclease
VVDPDAVSLADLGGMVGRVRAHRSVGRSFDLEQACRRLLAPIEPRNGCTISEYVGAKDLKEVLQRFLKLARWDADALRDVVCDYAAERLNDPRGMLVGDPTGFDVSLATEWVLPPNEETVQPNHVVLRVRNRIRTIELRGAVVQRRLPLDLADLPWGRKRQTTVGAQ